jgi:hypothetical protein
MRGCTRLLFLVCLVFFVVSPALSQKAPTKTPPKLPDHFDIAQRQHHVTIFGAAYDETLTQFGALVTGDFNGDGIADVAAGAVNSNGPDGLRHLAGAVYLFYGGSWPKEIDLAKKQKQKDQKQATPPADAVVYGAKAFHQLGYALAAGDVNGDGTDDLIVSAVNADGPNDQRMDSGEVYVLFGKLSGVIDLSGGKAGVWIYGARTGDFAGSALATGDINGDQIDDIIIGAKYAEDGQGSAGAAYVIFGQKNWGKDPKIDLAERPGDLVIYGREENSELGSAVASADVTGDGIQDLIVAAPLGDTPGRLRDDAGEVYIVYGKNFSSEKPTVINLKKDKADIAIYGADRHDRLGTVLSHCITLGTARRCADLNKDGIEDLVIGAPYAGGPENRRPGASGEAIVFLGAKNLPAQIDLADKKIRPAMVIYGRNLSDHLGSALATGDINGDGFSDLLVGAEMADGADAETGLTRKNSGEVYVIYGAKTLPAVIDVAKKVGPGPDVTVIGGSSNDRVGSAVALGDTNQDTFADLVIGAFDADGPALTRTNAGEVYLVYGLGPRPVLLKATKQSKVIGSRELTVDGLLEYTITIKNESQGQQEDNEGNELIDPLPLGMEIEPNSLKASAGKISYDPETRYVVWNGEIPPRESVTVSFRVRVRMPPGDLTVRNQAKVRYDSQGIFINDGVALTNITEDIVVEEFPEKLRLSSVSVVPNVSERTTAVAFNVQGRGIRLIQAHIFDLAGRQVFDSGRQPNGFSWKLQTNTGKSVSSGVYLFVLSVFGADGQIVRSELKKVLIRR